VPKSAAFAGGRIAERIRELTGRPHDRSLSIIDDTTEFVGIDRGDVIRLDGEFYLVHDLRGSAP